MVGGRSVILFMVRVHLVVSHAQLGIRGRGVEELILKLLRCNSLHAAS